MTTKIFIDQRANYALEFGEVLRSSAILYFEQSTQVKTTISFMNYWKHKNSMDVAVIANLRRIDGHLLIRERLDLTNCDVVNYRPVSDETEDFRGSVEIEIFSTKNLRIPYAAIMAVYESRNTVSMVHTYGRSYSQHELEDQRVIPSGEESCWPIYDSRSFRSFCVLHNGSQPQATQVVSLQVTRAIDGATRNAKIDLPEMPPFATTILYPIDHISGLDEFLQGEIGNASLSFKLDGAFSRILVGNETMNRSEVQVTHSNFNYSKHQTDLVDGNTPGLMPLLDLPTNRVRAIVFPDADDTNVRIIGPEKEWDFTCGKLLTISADGGLLRFLGSNNKLPSRIVTALEMLRDEGTLPSICSLGIYHINRPKKRFHWGLIAGTRPFVGRIFIRELADIYGECADDEVAVIRLYSATQKEYLERQLPLQHVISKENGNKIIELFEDADNFLGEDYGYVSLFSEYGGLIVYTTLEDSYGSITLEHSF